MTAHRPPAFPSTCMGSCEAPRPKSGIFGFPTRVEAAPAADAVLAVGRLGAVVPAGLGADGTGDSSDFDEKQPICHLTGEGDREWSSSDSKRAMRGVYTW